MNKNKKKIYIIDVTNRDGVQTSRLGLAKLQKTMINLLLNEMGVYQTEFGFPVTRHETSYLNANVELAKKGDINVDEIFSYRVEQKDDFLKGIFIENYGDERRLYELRNAIRWTLRRIYEKMASPGDQS